jgi:hypothetical protein
MTKFSGKSADESSLLPKQFADLEKFAKHWGVSTEKERTDSRLRSTYDETKAFHDAILPRLDTIFEYLNGFSLDALPDNSRRLLELTFALAEVAPSIHFYKGEPPVFALDVSRLQRWDIPNMTPEF